MCGGDLEELIETEPGRLDKFLKKSDLKSLEKPIVFERDEGRMCRYGCGVVCMGCLGTLGIAFCTNPRGMCFFCTALKYAGLKMTKEGVEYYWPLNPFCCLLRQQVTTLPYRNIQDVTVDYKKGLSIKSASGGTTIYVQYVKDPKKVQQVINHAVKLSHENRHTESLANAGLTRGASAVQKKNKSLKELVKKSLLSAEEAEAIQVGALVMEADPTHRLMEAAELYEQGTMSLQNFNKAKKAILKQVAQQTAPEDEVMQK